MRRLRRRWVGHVVRHVVGQNGQMDMWWEWGSYLFLIFEFFFIFLFMKKEIKYNFGVLRYFMCGFMWLGYWLVGCFLFVFWLVIVL